jgi:hypothetical protein
VIEEPRSNLQGGGARLAWHSGQAALRYCGRLP